MEPRTIAGLTISTEGPFVNLSFVDDTRTTVEHMIPVSTMGRIDLRTQPATEQLRGYARLELNVEGRTFLVVEDQGRDNAWRAGPAPLHSEAVFRGGVSAEDIIAIRDALQQAYKVAGNFRRG